MIPHFLMLDYRLVRSDRRTLALEVTAEGEVIVRAPRRLSVTDIERFVAAREAWIKKHLASPRPGLPEPSAQEEAALKARARQLMPRLVNEYAARLGLSPRYVKITSARKRLGSCNAKGGLCFSWRLMRYPLPVIQYVAAHEVAHLKELNHSAAFYQVLDTLMPDHRQRACLLKQPPLIHQEEENNAEIQNP
ncbi:MAG: M48 family metallopeptidase [Christensenellales bacterium]